MADRTAIEWCDSTFNPWIGCTRVSIAATGGGGCDNCYAARSTPARTLGVAWGPGEPRRRTAASTWDQPRAWQRQAAAFHAQHGRRRRVFCASVADVFDNEIPPAWRADIFDLIKATPDLDWLLLTKRIGNAWKMMADACGVSQVSLTLPLQNVWLGATVVNQAEVDRDFPKLLRTPAAVRFLSVEPMLGPITLPSMRCDHGSLPGPGGAGGVVCPDCDGHSSRGANGCPRLHWVICGGESGPKARPMHPDWAPSLRDQCAAAGVPFLFKQWGEWAPGSGFSLQPRGYIDYAGRFVDVDAGQDFPKGAESSDRWAAVHRAGKKIAGRLLVGRKHDEFPAATNEAHR